MHLFALYTTKAGIKSKGGGAEKVEKLRTTGSNSGLGTINHPPQQGEEGGRDLYVHASLFFVGPIYYVQLGVGL